MENKRYFVASVVVVLFCVVLVVGVVVPGYRNPASRMYTSGLGYASVKRSMGMPFDVETVLAKKRAVTIPYLGEGVVAGEPLRVPMIPMAMIKEVRVREGDRVKRGDVLIVLDNEAAERNVESAKLAVATAQAELARVNVGSAYVLAQERPEHDQIELDSAIADVRLLEQKVFSNQDMLKRGLVAREKVVDSERMLLEANGKLREAKFFAEMSKSGFAHSQHIAANALRDAEQTLEFRKKELGNYTVRAAADGLVSAVLVRAGEYNQDTGKPAILLTTGLWFEGYFDQSVLSRLREGQRAEIYLEAFPGRRWNASVERVIPEVTFAEGGPEISRPMRPRGTGAPEWAATFRVRFQIDSSGVGEIALGMTGNVRVLTEVDATSVPRGAVLSMAAGRGLLMVPKDADGWGVQPVGVGYIGDSWVEVTGISEEVELIWKGHRILKEGDKIRSKRVDW